ncbi:MAG: UDP-3-O-(3-hydroxymyristoyl)glucosamine N-acyltransferase [Elusimicrobia bacterium]|nr:UDP-3-O-(3-hydroxymyristoyl)glucosamine N-acyltransferase [Elusimicrobiota bacterium]
MKLTLKEIASWVSGELKSSTNIVIHGVAGLELATSKELSYLGNVKYIDLLKTTQAGCVLLPLEFKSRPDLGYSGPVIYVPNTQWAFVQILRGIEKEYKPKHPRGTPHPTAFIHPTAKLGKHSSVGAGCVVEEGAEIGDFSVLYPQAYVGHHAKIGKHCLIYPQVVLRENCELGDRVIVHAGTVIGSDGYGYLLQNGKHEKIPQIGRVVIEEEVEIGANTTIDRATTGETRIGAGTKIDNLVQIAHNVKVGKNCLIISQVGVAGSSELGDSVVLAGQVGVADHAKLGNRVVVGAQSGAMGNVPDGAILFGSPARPHREAMRLHALLGKLPEMYETLKKLTQERRAKSEI